MIEKEYGISLAGLPAKDALEVCEFVTTPPVDRLFYVSTQHLFSEDACEVELEWIDTKEAELRQYEARMIFNHPGAIWAHGRRNVVLECTVAHEFAFLQPSELPFIGVKAVKCAKRRLKIDRTALYFVPQCFIDYKPTEIVFTGKPPIDTIPGMDALFASGSFTLLFK